MTRIRDDEYAARSFEKMAGGTTFHFVTGGIHEALDRAREAVGGKDVRIGGGADTIRQYLRALGYKCVRTVASEKATHVELRRKENFDPASVRA